jgi:predicted nucleotidyltransferase
MVKIKRKQEESFRAFFGDLDISHLEGTIISAFFPEAEEMTIKEIKERVNYSYERVNSGLKLLTEKKIVIEKQRGKTLLYSLDLNSPYSYSLGFNRYMLQRGVEFIKKHRILFKAIQEIGDYALTWSVILFGSFSKGTENSQSDVDLIVTCLPKKEKEVENFVKSLRHKYGINFSPVVIPMHEFSNIKSDNPELWHDLRLYAIVFKGDDNFYYRMYKDG